MIVKVGKFKEDQVIMWHNAKMWIYLEVTMSSQIIKLLKEYQNYQSITKLK